MQPSAGEARERFRAGGLREFGGYERIQAAGGGNWRSLAGRVRTRSASERQRERAPRGCSRPKESRAGGLELDALVA